MTFFHEVGAPHRPWVGTRRRVRNAKENMKYILHTNCASRFLCGTLPEGAGVEGNTAPRKLVTRPGFFSDEVKFMTLKV